MKKSTGINNKFNNISEVYRKNFGPILGYTILVQIIFGVLSYIVNMIFYVLGILVTTPRILMESNTMSIISIGMLVFVLFTVTIVMAQFVKVGHIKAIIDAKAGVKVSFDKMFSYTFRHGKYIISSGIVVSLIYGGMLLAFGGILIGLNRALLLNISAGLQIIINLIMGSLFIAIMLVFMARTFYYLPIAVIEKKHFIRPIIDSFNMTKKEGKRLTIYIVSLFAASVVITSGMTGVVSIISGILTVLLSNTNPALMAVVVAISYVLMMIVTFISSIIVTPIHFMFVGEAYIEDRDRKYADDLFTRLDLLIDIQKERFKMEIGQYGESTNI